MGILWRDGGGKQVRGETCKKLAGSCVGIIYNRISSAWQSASFPL